MPELPDITVYLEALERRTLGRVLLQVRVASPFLLRTAEPPIHAIQGRKVVALRRLGKRIVFGFEGNYWLVLHLMIAGRLHWRDQVPDRSGGTPPRHGAGASRRAAPGRQALATMEFARGALSLTEAGTRKRASLHLVRGEAALKAHDPGGLEVLDASPDAFAAALTRENHTLKRALTDPRRFSGIGNAYSDEILHRAGLSPVALTRRLAPEEIARLRRAAVETLRQWTETLRREARDGFPENVTAFRPGMAVHGRFGRPCPVCGAGVQRIRYADNETNYCPGCQTAGRLLADRSLSRLLKRDWPRTPEELEELRAARPSLTAAVTETTATPQPPLTPARSRPGNGPSR